MLLRDQISQVYMYKLRYVHFRYSSRHRLSRSHAVHLFDNSKIIRSDLRILIRHIAWTILNTMHFYSNCGGVANPPMIFMLRERGLRRLLNAFDPKSRRFNRLMRLGRSHIVREVVIKSSRQYRHLFYLEEISHPLIRLTVKTSSTEIYDRV